MSRSAGVPARRPIFTKAAFTTFSAPKPIWRLLSAKCAGRRHHKMYQLRPLPHLSNESSRLQSPHKPAPESTYLPVSFLLVRRTATFFLLGVQAILARREFAQAACVADENRERSFPAGREESQNRLHRNRRSASIPSSAVGVVAARAWHFQGSWCR